MTVVNPKSISGINSITTGSGSDNLLTIHTSDASSTERVRINSSGDVIVGSGITVSPDGDIFATGVTTATTFSGSGANLTNLPAANITGTLPAISAANLTNVPAANITGTLPAISGANLTNLPAANITGTLPAISGANLTSLPAQATIANNSDNRVITGGSGVNLNGESNVTFDGTTFDINGKFENTAAAGGDYVAKFQNLTPATPYTVQIREPGSATAGYPLINISNNAGNTEYFRVDSGRGVTKLVMHDGAGIDFSSNTENESGAGSSSAQLLDDYEEGTWTPTWDAPDQSGTTFGLNHQYGYYTKIGNLVHVTCYLQGFADANNGGGSNDNLVITGLPFTVADLPGGGQSRHAASFAVGSRYRMLVDDLILHTFAGTTEVRLFEHTNGNAMVRVKTNQITARSGTNECYFAGSYRVHA